MSLILEARDIKVSYGNRTVLDIPSIQVEQGKVLALIGPNGSGKTTLLLCLSLLLKPNQGSIRYQGAVVPNGFSILQMRRRFAVAFQEPLLLNTTVWENVTMGLRFRGFPQPEVRARAEYWLERFGIASLASQQARTLSGGEAQRANLARALALQPEILFLDEPFSAVDIPTRQGLFEDIFNILRETHITTVMVTHDRNEAQILAHQIILLMNGTIAQSGNPREIFSSPVNEDVAKFVGMENILEGTLTAVQDCLADVDINGQIVTGISTCNVGGAAVNVCIRPEDITLSAGKPSSSARNIFTGRVTGIVPSGPLVRVSLDCGFPLIALITRMSSDELKLEIGTPVFASFKAVAIHVIRVK